MDKTAEQIHNEFHDQLLEIITKNGDKLIGYTAYTSGLEKAGSLVPNSSFLNVNVITDLEDFNRKGIKYVFREKPIHPNTIKSIRKFDLLGQ